MTARNIRITGFLFAAALAAAALPAAAAGIAGFHAECKACHSATPPSASNANPDACVSCHGEEPDKGSITVNGKTLNPHKGHFDTINCTDCHKPHAAAVNGCQECHKEAKATMPEK
ncbi:MAG: hypothetical protein ACFWTZ_05350 [Burkholderia sp.]|jgi:poly(3-hydroxybutyrate) depolymerase